MTCFFREIRAAKKRAVIVVCQEHGQRPTAGPLREHLLRDLVDAIHVRSLFAVDLDVDKAFVEDAGCFGVFERFVGPFDDTSGTQRNLH